MTMQRFHATHTDSAGNILSGATVTVVNTGTAVTPDLFTDESGTTKSNPFTTGSDGAIDFYVADGDYDIQAVKSGYDTKTWTDVQFLDRATIYSAITANTNNIDYYWDTVAERTAQGGMSANELGLMTNTASNRTAGVVGKVYGYISSVWTELYRLIIEGADLIIADGGTIGQSGGALLTFDDTNNDLELTGADFNMDDGKNIGVQGGVNIKLDDTNTRLDIDSGVLRTQAGILFNTDTASENTLDDYEEGTWTPVLQFGGGSASIVYGIQTGFYTKIGNIVTCICRLAISNKGSSTGQAAVAGLPFTGANGIYYNNPIDIRSVTFSVIPYLSMNGGTTILSMVEVNASGVASTITNTDFTNAADVYFTISYKTA
jgi:hypothetical protein